MLLLLLALLPPPVGASPFAPHPLPPPASASPFFEGWYTRVVSHDASLSLSVILGSFRPAHGAALTEVWACLLLDRAGEVTTTQRFLDPSLLRLTAAGQNVTAQPKLGTPAAFVWEHPDAGTLAVQEDSARLDFRFPRLRVQAQLAGRVPWDRAAPDSAGPEGWLAGAEGLLPTHYFVQTLASTASFTLTDLAAGTDDDGAAAIGSSATLSGRGFAHQEANWGGTFPTAWVWAEAIAADGNAQLVLTAGEFDIAGITTQQAIVAVRTPTASLTLRNIDLDLIVSTRRPCAAVPSFSLEAVSRNSTHRLTVVLEAPRRTFSQRLEAPSHSGFTASPGSVESYSATVRVELFQRQSKLEAWKHIDAFTIDRGALEFGGADIEGCLNASSPLQQEERKGRPPPLRTDDGEVRLDALTPHPRLRLTETALKKIKTTVATDRTAEAIAAALVQHGTELLDAPVVNCSLAGVEHSLLGQARSVLDRTYTLGLLYRLDNNNTKWALRAIKEMLHVTTDASCADWNPNHFLDVAEMMHAVAVGYDWLYHAPPSVLSAADRDAIADGLATRGLAVCAAHWDLTQFTVSYNWNLVCNGGRIAASLALLDSTNQTQAALAGAVLANATRDIQLSLMLSYAPEGAWPEGPTYWGYGTKYALVAIEMLSTATGTDQGLGAAHGFNLTGGWRIANTSPSAAMFNWGDSDDTGPDEFMPNFFGLAQQPQGSERAVDAFYGHQIFSRTLRCAEAGCALSLLDYSAQGSTEDLHALPTCQSFLVSDCSEHESTAHPTCASPKRLFGYMRSDWRGTMWNSTISSQLPPQKLAQPVWLAFKGGNGQANHNDLDGGQFVFEMAGKRWAVDLGADSYGLSGYWDKSASHGHRYSYYRKSTRGHNTLTFDATDEHPGWSAQDPEAVSEIISFSCDGSAEGGGGGPHALLDLSPSYRKAGGPMPPHPATAKVMRGFTVTDDFARVVVRDEWTAAGAQNLTWSMHFEDATVTLSADKRTATLTATKPFLGGDSGSSEEESEELPSITATIDEPAAGASFEVATPVIPAPAHPVGSLRKLMVVVDPKVVQKLQVSFALPGTPPLVAGAINPLSAWERHGAAAGGAGGGGGGGGVALRTDDDELLLFNSSVLLPPLYRQCDPKWGSMQMGVKGDGEQSTICREGCAMTCVAMALAAHGFVVPCPPPQLRCTPDPATLNDWLQEHHGYHCAAGDCNNLVLNAPDLLTGGRVRLVGEWSTAAVSHSGKINNTTSIVAGVSSGEMIYLAHVHNPEVPSHPVDHFVLLDSVDIPTQSFGVRDPYFNETRYPLSAIADVLMYEVLPPAALVPLPYPLYKQCDPAWAEDKMGGGGHTVCQVGCLMSSTSMALNQRGILIDGKPSTPGTLNAWLRDNHGYVQGTDDFEESATERINPTHIKWTNASMHRTNDLGWDDVVRLVDSHAAVIINVMHGEHFVLVVGYDKKAGGDTLYVNDPGFNRQSYSYSKDVVGYRLFDLTPVA